MQDSTRMIFVLCYRDTNALYGAAGAQRKISCNHEKLGSFYINNVLEVVLTPQNTIPLSAEGNELQRGVGFWDAGNITADSHLFADANFKPVYQIKDFDSGVTSYVDRASYDSAVIGCNYGAAYPSICGVATALSAGTPAATTATITFTGGANAVGYEWVNQATPSTAPTGNGTFTITSPISLTSLTAAHAYRIWIRTICGSGVESAWVSLNFTTHA